MRIVIPDAFGRLHIGRVGENEVVTVQIKVTGWSELYGSGTFTLLHKRSSDAAAYPCVVSVENETVSWIVTAADAQYSGQGQAELVYTVNSKIAKSVIYTTICEESLDGSGTPPEPWQSWVNTVIAAKEAAEAAAESIKDSTAEASVDANTGTPSVDVSVTEGSEGENHFNFAFHNLKGAKGDTGEKGDTGAAAYTFTESNGHIVIAESEA